MVIFAALICGIYLAQSSDSDRADGRVPDEELLSKGSTGAQVSIPSVVTVRAFVPPQGSAAKGLPTVPVLSVPDLGANRAVAPNAGPRPALAASNPAVEVQSAPAKVVRGTSKLDDEDGSEDENANQESQSESSPDSPALSTKSMEELYREVQELEQQERRAMATRAAALQKAMTGTSNCDDGDAACNQAHLDVKWKTAKDKYEQASFQNTIHDRMTERSHSSKNYVPKLHEPILRAFFME